MTYTMGYLSVANSPDDLLTSEETSKASGIRVCIDQGAGKAFIPNNALGTGKEVLQQLILVAELHLYMPVSEARCTTDFIDLVDTIDGLLSIRGGLELNIAIHCFGGGPFHDDMNRAAFIRTDQASLTANKLDNLLLGDRVGDL